MAVDFSQTLVIGISSRALFELEQENKIFETAGLGEYSAYQLEHEDETLHPGVGFPLINALLKLNHLFSSRRAVEVVIISRNNHDTGIRILNSVKHYNLDITRSAFTSGEPVAKYLDAFDVDLFLSASSQDVQNALDCKIAAGLICDSFLTPHEISEQIRIAFDGDAVIFSEEAEKIYQEQGLEAFMEFEQKNALNPLPEGPFAKLLKTISFLQFEVGTTNPPIRTALITARNSPAHERVIRTLRAWKVRIDETFFLGGLAKDKVLTAFKPHIFFDDHPKHCGAASKVVPTARVLSSIHKT